MGIITSSRRIFMALFAGIILAGAVLAILNPLSTTANKQVVSGLPLAAPYTRPLYVGEYPYTTYTGWGTVHYRRDLVDPYFSSRTVAYRWTSNGWVQTSRPYGTRVWIAPFSGEWSWTWTSATGWLAMRDNALVVRWEPVMIAT